MKRGAGPAVDELGDRLGGRAFNIMVPRGLNDSEFEHLVDRVVLPVIDRQRPGGMVMTLGADALQGDPLSAMMLSNGALWRAAEACIARTDHAVILGGGGYNPWTTTRLWAGLWGRLCGNELPNILPEQARLILEGLECDLIDPEEREARWLTTICDGPNPGPVRPVIAAIVRQLMPEELWPC